MLFPCLKGDLGGGIIHYYPAHLEPAGRFETQREYAEARTKMAMICVDGVPCGRLADGTPVVVLVLRAEGKETDGPFPGQYWVVGGRWNIVDTFPEFMRKKAIGELFNGKYDGIVEVGEPMCFTVVTWGKDEGGPYGLQGTSLQPGFKVEFKTPFTEDMFRPDADHTGYQILRPGDSQEHLHPYVRDLIEMTGWLRQ